MVCEVISEMLACDFHCLAGKLGPSIPSSSWSGRHPLPTSPYRTAVVTTTLRATTQLYSCVTFDVPWYSWRGHRRSAHQVSRMLPVISVAIMLF